MSGPSFRSVRGLGDDELRDLLAVGAARERVWAAWELGLRMGETEAPGLLERLRLEANGGARRHLIVMLAGFGEIDPVVTLARFDPDDRVRATATQYALSLGEAFPHVYEALVTAPSDGAACVRRAFVTYLPVEAPSFLVDALERLLLDDDHEVQRAVVQRLLGEGEFRESMKAIALDRAKSSVLREPIWSAWRERDSEGFLASILATEDAALFLAEIARRTGSFAEVELLTIAESGAVEPLTLLDFFPENDLGAPLRRYLLDRIASGVADIDFRERAMGRLMRSYPAADIDAVERNLAAALRARLGGGARAEKPPIRESTGELKLWTDDDDGHWRLRERFKDVLDHYLIRH